MAAPPSDPTFTTYTRSQAQSYFQNRLSYPSKLYNTIIDYHTSTGGQLDVLADIGCGPGRATRDLAAAFDYAVGLDPGVEMIRAASDANKSFSSSSSLEGKGDKATTRTGREVVFAVCGAEDCARGVADALANSSDIIEEGGRKVDLLTAAMAVCFKLWIRVVCFIIPISPE